MRGLALAAVLTALAPPALAVPPPPSGVEIDCARTTYASEQLICSDTGLKARETAMTALYRQAVASAQPSARGVLETGQRAWMAERNLCAFQADGRACVVAQYTARAAALRALIAPAR